MIGDWKYPRQHILLLHPDVYRQLHPESEKEKKERYHRMTTTKAMIKKYFRKKGSANEESAKG